MTSSRYVYLKKQRQNRIYLLNLKRFIQTYTITKDRQENSFVASFMGYLDLCDMQVNEITYERQKVSILETLYITTLRETLLRKNSYAKLIYY